MSIAPDIRVDISPETERAFRLAAKETPREVQRSFHIQAPILRKRLIRAMGRAGGDGVPDFAGRHALSRRLSPQRRAGGKLADPFAILYQRRKAELTVGWRRSFDRHALDFQTAENRAYTLMEKRMVHAVFGRLAGRRSRRLRAEASDLLREGYRRPARPVIRPFAEHQAPIVWQAVLDRVKRKAAQAAKAGAK